jgi:hypothetical protein
MLAGALNREGDDIATSARDAARRELEQERKALEQQAAAAAATTEAAKGDGDFVMSFDRDPSARIVGPVQLRGSGGLEGINYQLSFSRDKKTGKIRSGARLKRLQT